MVDHAALGNSELHEPKGVASASDSTVYTADGLGSGSWDYIFKEESIARAFTGVSREITDLGDYAAIIVTLPTMTNGDNNNEWFRFQVGNDAGYTTSTVYYSGHWYYSGDSYDSARAEALLQYSYTSNPSADQTMRLLFTNWNKEYYTIASLIGGMQSLPRQGLFFIREQKAYTKLRITSPSNIINGTIYVQGFKG